jgi:hypothetical protein
MAAATLVLAIGASAAGEAWLAVEQPELKDTLERAPTLQTELLGEPARGVNVWERWLVPNLDGKSWDVLQIYFKEYYGPTWLYAIDLGTGQVNKQRLADGHQFYLSGRALGFDGKYYIATPSRKTWSMDLFVYDPATNTLEERGEIVPGLGGEVRPLVTGPDGRIYGTGTRDNRVGLYIYDPKLGKVVKDFGPVGPSHPNGACSRYVMGVDDTHAYIVSGMIPAWYLVAVNLTTGEEKVLLESPTERVMDIIERFPSAYARVPQDGGAPDKEYWLYHGQATPKTNDTPPWPKQASPWDKAVPKPEVYFDQIDPDSESNATLWYRSAKDADWKSVRLEGVPSYAHRINPMSILPDGRLYGTGDDYAGVFVFDPRTDQTTILGPRPGLAPYTQIVCGGKLYSSGYSGGHLFVYDPARPWTLSKGGPPGHSVPDQADARSNARYLGDFDRTTRVGLMHSSALGADGRIYFGGFGLRHYTGGGFGWYDPKTQKMDGFWKPLSGYAVQWIASALDGRLIVISTIRAADELNDNRAPEEARLFVYDVSEQKIARQIVPMAKGRTTGLVAEVAPGRVLGLTSSLEQSGRSALYGVDVTTGEVLFTKDLPSPVSVDDYWPHWVDPSYEYNAFVRGPDGFVWTYLKDVLVRIDPKDASVHVVGKIDPVGWPTFVGNDVYFSGPEQLRRIRNIVPAPGEHPEDAGPTKKYAKTGNRDDREPLFRFLQIADTHVYEGPPHPTNHCALANEKAKWMVETVGRGKHLPVPDFVIHSGDMIDGEPQSAGVKLLGPDLGLFKEMIQSLRCPFHPCIGNHENQQQEGDAAFERSYREAFGADQDNYAFRHGGIRFVVFNNSGSPNSNLIAGRARDQWLRQTLDASPEEPTILCCHIPLIPLREEQVLSRSFGFGSYEAHDAELLEIVEAHADTVIAVLSGHLHLTGVAQRSGIYHIVPSGSATYPCDHGALFTVFPDRIKVQMQSLPRELAVPNDNAIGVRGSIHGKPRHDQDFVDGGHPTAQLYQCGRSDEREFEIPLSGKKRLGVK